MGMLQRATKESALGSAAVFVVLNPDFPISEHLISRCNADKAWQWLVVVVKEEEGVSSCMSASCQQIHDALFAVKDTKERNKEKKRFVKKLTSKNHS